MTDKDSTEIGAKVERRFVVGVLWNMVAMVFAQGLTFTSNIILANILGIAKYGQYSIILSTVTTVATVGQVATGITASKFVAQNRERNPVVAGEIIGLCCGLTIISGLIGVAILSFGAELVADQMLKSVDLRKGLLVSAGATLFLTINAYQVGALAGMEKFRASTLAAGAAGLFQLVSSIVGGLLNALSGALWGLVIGSVARWLIYNRLLSHSMRTLRIPFVVDGIKKQKEVLLHFALPAAICGLSSMPALWFANAMLVKERGFEQLAMFSAAFQLKSMVVLLPGMLSNVGAALLNHQRGMRNVKGYTKIFWLNVAISAGTAVAVAGVIGVFSKAILTLYGPAFSDAALALRILLFSAVVEGVATGVFQLVQSKGRMWSAFFLVVLPRDLLMVVLALLLIPTYSVLGMAISYSAAWLFGSFVTFWMACRVGLELNER